MEVNPRVRLSVLGPPPLPHAQPVHRPRRGEGTRRLWTSARLISWELGKEPMLFPHLAEREGDSEHVPPARPAASELKSERGCPGSRVFPAPKSPGVSRKGTQAGLGGRGTRGKVQDPQRGRRAEGGSETSCQLRPVLVYVHPSKFSPTVHSLCATVTVV